MSGPNPRNRKTISRHNYRFAKTYDPNYEPWLTMEEMQSFTATKQKEQNSQNGSMKGE